MTDREDLTPAQLWAMDCLANHGAIGSGMMGITLNTARSLERRGLVTIRKTHRTVAKHRGGSKRIDMWWAFPVKKEES